jgi:hypothetical protein
MVHRVLVRPARAVPVHESRVASEVHRLLQDGQLDAGLLGECGQRAHAAAAAAENDIARCQCGGQFDRAVARGKPIVGDWARR